MYAIKQSWKLPRLAVVLVLILALCLPAFASAEKSQAGYTYTLPEGFTAQETFDPYKKNSTLTLTQESGLFVITLAFAQHDELAGTDLTEAEEEDIPRILAIIGIDAEALGLNAVLDFGMILLYDETESRLYHIDINADGTVMAYAASNLSGEEVTLDQYQLLLNFMRALAWEE